jgi:hypothetical protein
MAFVEFGFMMSIFGILIRKSPIVIDWWFKILEVVFFDVVIDPRSSR